MDPKRPLTPNRHLLATILTAFIVMLVLSLIAFFREGPVNQPAAGNSFVDGFRAGFASSHISRSLISALLFGVIAGIRRKLLTTAGALILIVLATVHFWHYAAAFPSLSDALKTLAPALMIALIGPSSWVEYFLVWRVYRAWCAVKNQEFAAQE
jgi:hypothetical protein